MTSQGAETLETQKQSAVLFPSNVATSVCRFDDSYKNVRTKNRRQIVMFAGVYIFTVFILSL